MNLKHLPIQFALFSLLLALFMLPVVSFNVIKPTTNTSENNSVLGTTTAQINGVTFENKNGTTKFSVMLNANSQTRVNLPPELVNKEIYLSRDLNNVFITVQNQTLHISNPSPTSQYVEGVFY